jgi:hypothetical protein
VRTEPPTTVAAAVAAATATAPAGDRDVVAAVTRPLLEAVDSITVEEFRAQDVTFDRDSRRGRELLYLAAGGDWLPETAEVVDVRRASAVDTTLRLTVDPGRIRHEAFHGARAGGGEVLLPLLALPLAPGRQGAGAPDADDAGDPDDAGGPGGAAAAGAPAEAALALTVTDRDGTQVAPLAPAEVRHVLAAALADALLGAATVHRPGATGAPVVRRAERLVLSAALDRMLRDRWRGSRAGPDGRHRPGGPPAPPGPAAGGGHGTGRLRGAQAEVRRLLTKLAAEHAAGPLDAGDAAAQARRALTRRAAAVLDAVANSLWLVLPARLDAGPTTYTVRLPPRRLVRTGPAVPRRPRCRLAVDLLFPAADADRRVTVRLPDGVTWEAAPGGEPAADVRVDVDRPRTLSHLEELMGQLLDARRGPVAAPVARCLADLATSRVDAVRQTLAHHRPPADGDRDPARDPARDLRALRATLQGPVPSAAVAAAWRRVALPGTLRRDTTVSAVSPGVLEARTERVDDPAQRGRPLAATAVVDVAVTDSELLGSARFAGGMNLVLMTAVLAFLLHSRGRANVEVVAPALTLFAAVQAARVAHPDRTTLRGLLSATGYWLVIPSILPTVMLAVALAFVPADAAPAPDAESWAALAIAGQLAFQVALHRARPAASRRPARPPAFTLATRPLVDLDRLAVLRSAWWRAATHEALLVGREAHAYLIWDRGRDASEDGQDARDARAAPAADAWVTPSDGADVLAVLRSGTPRQTLSFVAFREPPPAEWAAAHGARPLSLAPLRPAPREAPAESVDVFVGIPRTAPAARVAAHPLTRVLRLAADQALDAADVQLPVPPPAAARCGLRWLRVRVGVPEAELYRCRRFLEALHAATTAAGWAVTLQVVPEIDARTSFSAGGLPGDFLGDLPGELPDDRRSPPVPVPASELDVLDAGAADADPTAPLWCVVALCGLARTGLAADVLETLGAGHPDLRLGGLTSAVLRGTSVSLLLLRRPDGAVGAPPDLAGLLAAYAADHLTAPLVEAQSAVQLGTPPGAGDGPLLRVHLRAPDRPGLVAAMLRAVRAALPAAFGDLVAWHVQGQVAEGRTATLRLVLRLPESTPVARWGPERWEDLEREVRRRVGAGGAGAGDPVVSAHLLRAVGAAGLCVATGI